MRRRTFLAAPALVLATPARAAIQRRQFGASRATVEIEGEVTPAFENLVDRWITRSAVAVMLYYGKFPVPEIYVNVRAGNSAGVRGGQTFPGEVPLIRIRVGGASSEADLMVKDWVMVHEMVHLAFPWMNLNHNWMAEGLAVYVESIARLQAGHLAPARIWSDFVHMMPRGLPQPGDGGYDVTVNWGRTYWGGAIFCLLADVAIRKETDNAKGLRHALRAINAGRDFRREWDFAETLAIGDNATGHKVLVTQYEAMKDVAVSPDLDALWRDLGIRIEGNGVAFDNAATLADVRLAIEGAA